MWYTILFFQKIYIFKTTSVPFSNHKYGLIPFKTPQRFDTTQKKNTFLFKMSF